MGETIEMVILTLGVVVAGLVGGGISMGGLYIGLKSLRDKLREKKNDDA